MSTPKTRLADNTGAPLPIHKLPGYFEDFVEFRDAIGVLFDAKVGRDRRFSTALKSTGEEIRRHIYAYCAIAANGRREWMVSYRRLPAAPSSTAGAEILSALSRGGHIASVGVNAPSGASDKLVPFDSREHGVSCRAVPLFQSIWLNVFADFIDEITERGLCPYGWAQPEYNHEMRGCQDEFAETWRITPARPLKAEGYLTSDHLWQLSCSDTESLPPCIKVVNLVYLRVFFLREDVERMAAKLAAGDQGAEAGERKPQKRRSSGKYKPKAEWKEPVWAIVQKHCTHTKGGKCPVKPKFVEEKLQCDPHNRAVRRSGEKIFIGRKSTGGDWVPLSTFRTEISIMHKRYQRQNSGDNTESQSTTSKGRRKR